MKRLIVIESDTQYHSLFAYEATEVNGHVIVKGEQVAAEINRPDFFGKVNRLLVTKDDLNDAEPITPTVEAPAAQ